MSESLPERLLKERDRVRAVRKSYVSIGPSGAFAINFVIDPALKLADEALTEHDVVKMVNALKELETIKE